MTDSRQQTQATYTRAEMMELLRVSARTMTRLQATTNVGQFRVGKATRYSKRFVDKHLADAIPFPKLVYKPRSQRV